MSPEAWVALAALATTLLGWVIWLTWWLGGQFSKNREHFSEKLQKMGLAIEGKLESHEKEDSRRFESLNKELWSIKIRNAMKDGAPIPITPPVLET